MAKGAKTSSTGGVAARVETLVRPAIESLGLVLWDVRFEKEGALWVLKVLIDRADGEAMDTDLCEAASRAVDPILDAADPIEQRYFLEVGSPGLGRHLTKPAHFAAWQGKKVLARLYAPDAAGRKEMAGVLQGFEDGVVTLDADGEAVAIPLKQAALFKACDDENLFN